MGPDPTAVLTGDVNTKESSALEKNNEHARYFHDEKQANEESWQNASAEGWSR